MVREEISFKDFNKIAKENEYFLWHFLQKKQHKNLLSFSTILGEKKEYNELEILLEYVDIPYFESYTEDSIDFLNTLGFDYKLLWSPKTKGQMSNLMEFQFRPIIIGFKRNINVISTFETCYCLEGVIKIINTLDSKYSEQIIKSLQ
jgi:hypothetical protein